MLNKILKFLLLLMLILFFIAISLLISKYFIKKEIDLNNDNNYYIEDNKENSLVNENTPVDEDTANYLQAIENKDYERCLLLEDNNDKNLCVKDVAMQKLDLDICALIDDHKEESLCVNKVEILAAIQNKDLFFCSELSNDDDQLLCIKKIAEQGISINDCDQIPLKFVTLEDMKTGNDIELRNVCKSEVIYKQAIEDNNFFLCESIISAAIKDKCVKQLD